jgi:ribosomal protein S4
MRLLRFQLSKKKKRQASPPFSYKSYLYEKKKCSKIYGNLKHKTVFDYCNKARQLSGKVNNNLVFLLEQRLDVALYKIRFCESISKARQIITHGQILVNNKLMRIPSYALVVGDVIKATCPLKFSRMKRIKKIRQKKTNSNLLFLQRKGLLFQSFKRQLRKRHRFQQKYPILKSLNFEVNYAVSLAIFLFIPQKLFLPTEINANFVDRSLR